ACGSNGGLRPVVGECSRARHRGGPGGPDGRGARARRGPPQPCACRARVLTASGRSSECSMRILRAIRSVNPEGGGPIEGILQVSRALLRSGHEVELISLDAPDDPWVWSCPLPVYARGKGGTDYGYSREYVPWLKQH